MNRLISLITLVLCLTGCVSAYKPLPPPASDPATTKMAESGASISNSLYTLEAIKKVEHPGYKKHLPYPYALEMNRVASVDWTGPIGPLIQRLAYASNYKLRVLGQPPAIPVIVAIAARDISLGHILRDADYQAGSKADIAVYPQERIIELRYHKL